MQAIRVHEFGNPPTLSYDEVPDPTPTAGEIVVDVEAIGVNPADTYVAGGAYAIVPELPYTPGMEASGTILKVGEGVTRWSEGDRVFIATTVAGKLQGAYAEQVVCNADDVYELPSALTFAQGAALNIAYVTAFRALIDVAQVRPGESVLVHGATGGVGIAAVQIALAHKLDVWATGGSEKGRQLLEQQGVPAAQVLDHHAPDHLARLPEQGVNVIIEMLANVNLPVDLGMLAPFGRVVVVGNRGESIINARDLMARQASIVGLTYWSGGDAAVRRALAAIVQGIDAGDIRPVVQEEIPLRDAGRAWSTVMAGESRGKVVLVP